MTNINIGDGIPWVEKYRPERFEDIILNDINKNLLDNMINQNYIPNLLFYGPPGTGKQQQLLI